MLATPAANSTFASERGKATAVGQKKPFVLSVCIRNVKTIFLMFHSETKIYLFLVHCKNRWKLLLLSFSTCVDYGSESGRVGCHSAFRIVIVFGLSNSHHSNHSHSFYSHSGIAQKNEVKFVSC